MSGQLRALKNRIRSVESTKKITRAMEMVAAAKLQRFQSMMTKGRPYTDGLENLLKRLIATEQSEGASSAMSHPFFEKRDEKRIAVVVMTSDTGLCGSYNHDLAEKAIQFIRPQDNRPLLAGVGKMGISTLKSLGYEFSASFADIRVSQIEDVLKNLKGTLESWYLERKVDAIYVVYSHFLTLSSYQSVIEKLLPFEKAGAAGEESSHESSDYLFEPDKPTIFEKLVPLFFEAKIRMMFLESFVSEQIARMTAMHQATENAKEMIESLVLKRNKARQAAITKELIEIVSGSQALKLK